MKLTQVLCAALITFTGMTATVQAGDKVSPEAVTGATTVDAKKAKELFDQGIIFVDVRKDSDWNAGRIPDAIHLDLKTIFNAENLEKEVKKTEPLVMYCNGPKCLRSSKASAKAIEWGFSKIYYFREGYPAWKAEGYPTE